MTVVHVAAECFPVLKAGGLGDVVGSLPKYLTNKGVDTKVIVPYYNSPFVENASFVEDYKKHFLFGEFYHPVTFWKEEKNLLGFDLYLVEIPHFFPREKVYGYTDDTERFIFFQTTVLHFLNEWIVKPDLVHTHDHHTGLIPFLMKYGDDFEGMRDIPSVYTIHNGEYSGQFGWDKMRFLPNFDQWQAGMIDYEGDINPMVAGIKNAWKVTTVSEGYLEELRSTNNSTGVTVNEEQDKCIGILNGIDTEVWSPDVDNYIEYQYEIDNVIEGKKTNKETICYRYGLNPKHPLIVFVGRMVYEKGADIIPMALELVLNHRKDVSFLIIGSGFPHIEGEIEYMKSVYSKNINTYIGYDESLAHMAYAAADFLMMPSRVEPCGLNQMYSMHYGTIPIVRQIGGLKDTVHDVGDEGEGFTFYDMSSHELARTIHRALDFKLTKAKKEKHLKRLMEIDFSWDKSAEKYIDMYNDLIKN